MRSRRVPQNSGLAASVRIGSEAHKKCFCRMLLDTFDPYKPAVIDWPELSYEARARLHGLPFWGLAVASEGLTAKHMQAIAESTADALIREALARIAFEERRHKEVIEVMLRHYGIAVEDEPAYVPSRSPTWAYLRTGYGECFDSFFAFGLFKLAHDSGFFPPELVDVFEPVIQEEARHILFFANWVAYMRVHTPHWKRPAFTVRRALAISVQVGNRLKLARGMGQEPESMGHMSWDGQAAFDFKLSPRAFIDLCLRESERRLSRYDACLRRPLLMSTLMRCTRPLMNRF
jgi:hypothetical protein